VHVLLDRTRERLVNTLESRPRPTEESDIGLGGAAVVTLYRRAG
jgi:hypothetical protein